MRLKLMILLAVVLAGISLTAVAAPPKTAKWTKIGEVQMVKKSTNSDANGVVYTCTLGDFVMHKVEYKNKFYIASPNTSTYKPAEYNFYVTIGNDLYYLNLPTDEGDISAHDKRATCGKWFNLYSPKLYPTYSYNSDLYAYAFGNQVFYKVGKGDVFYFVSTNQKQNTNKYNGVCTIKGKNYYLNIPTSYNGKYKKDLSNSNLKEPLSLGFVTAETHDAFKKIEGELTLVTKNGGLQYRIQIDGYTLLITQNKNSSKRNACFEYKKTKYYLSLPGW